MPLAFWKPSKTLKWLENRFLFKVSLIEFSDFLHEKKELWFFKAGMLLWEKTPVWYLGKSEGKIDLYYF